MCRHWPSFFQVCGGVCWSQSQLSKQSFALTMIPTVILKSSFNLRPNVHTFGLCEKTRVPGKKDEHTGRPANQWTTCFFCSRVREITSLSVCERNMLCFLALASRQYPNAALGRCNRTIWIQDQAGTKHELVSNRKQDQWPQRTGRERGMHTQDTQWDEWD